MNVARIVNLCLCEKELKRRTFSLGLCGHSVRVKRNLCEKCKKCRNRKTIGRKYHEKFFFLFFWHNLPHEFHEIYNSANGNEKKMFKFIKKIQQFSAKKISKRKSLEFQMSNFFK